MPDFSPSDTQAIIDTADRLQIDPKILAATLHYESNFNPRASGPSGKGYPVRGLIGFDPENVRKYGEPGATIAAQMPQIEQYLLDRGWKPGQFAPNDLGRLYSIINAGGLDKNDQPYWNRRDTNGSIAQHVERIQRGSMGPAEKFLAQSEPMGAITSAIGAVPSATPTGSTGKLFRDAGFDVPGAAAASPAPSVAAPAGARAAKPRSIFEDAGFTLPTGKAVAPKPLENAPPGAADYIETRGGGRQYIDAKGNFVQPPSAEMPPPPSLENSIAYRGSGAAARAGAAKIGEEIASAYKPSAELAKRGWEGVLSGRPATGLGDVALGGLGMISSPVTGVIRSMVERPVTEYSGNPRAGEVAGLVAGGLPALGGTRAAVSAVSPANRATNALVDAIGAENVPKVAARLRANPQLSLADVSDPVRTMTQGLAADPAQPAAQRIVQDAVRQRAAEAPAQINSAYTQAMGPAPDTVRMVDWLKERARQAGRDQIEPALRGAKPVDTSPVVSAIDAAVKPGLQAMLDPATRLPLSSYQQELLRLKQQLVAPTGETLTDARRLHDVQSRLGDMAYQLTQSADGKDRYLGSQLRGINEKLISQIDEASGGTYRPARAKFKDAKDIHQAWEEGFDVLKNRSGVPGLQDRPEALREWLKTATPEEITAKQLGVRSDIDQKIKGVRNQVLAGTNITKIEYNRDKLEMLFGTREADRLVRTMEDAADVARTNQKLTEGSKTAETLAGREALAVRPTGGGNPLTFLPPVLAELMGQSAGLPVLGGASMLGLKGAQLGFQKVGQLSDRARNAAFARAAMARGQDREGVLSALASHPKVIRELEQRRGALTP